ncbi:MAG: GNAT family N-acetyltransferase [Dehalococcoidia bacterium]
MTAEYRPLTSDDLEQAAYLETVAFYGPPSPERAEILRQFFPPDWTVGAFVDGKLVADVRTVPMTRRMNGGRIPFGAVGPVACLADFRRHGHVGKLLRLSLERMRDQGQATSGLHTPHDALYRRFGWERAEGKKRYQFEPNDVRLRFKGAKGSLERVSNDDWGRLEAVYRIYGRERNGPLHRIEPWWRQNILREYDNFGGPLRERDAFVWASAEGQDEGYVVYVNRSMGRDGDWQPQEIWVRDFVSLSADAHLGLWEHMLTHDLATRLTMDAPLTDPFRDLCEDPSAVQASMGEGALHRIVDVERALGMRPYVGEKPVAFTMGIADATAPWNEGVWRVEAGEGRMRAERVEGKPDVELTANTLAPLFTGHMRPEVAAGVGLLKVREPEALAQMAEAFAVSYPAFCNDLF